VVTVVFIIVSLVLVVLTCVSIL